MKRERLESLMDRCLNLLADVVEEELIPVIEQMRDKLMSGGK